jgi:hypothetical protein
VVLGFELGSLQLVRQILYQTLAMLLILSPLFKIYQ